MNTKSKSRETLLLVACSAAALSLAQLYALGALGGIGPLKSLHSKTLARVPGNAPEYRPENLNVNARSPLAGKHILFLGSSVTRGFASMDVSMADYIGILDGCKSTKEAVNGTTMAGTTDSTYVSRLMKLDPALRFDAVVCQVSTNDASQKKPLGTVSSSFSYKDFDCNTVIGALETIIAYSKETWNCPVILYTGTKFRSRAYEAMVDALPVLQSKWGAAVLDLWNDAEMNAVSPKDYALYMHDPVHPTQAGYLRWWTPKFEQILYDTLSK